MIVSKKSDWSGEVHTMDLDVTEEGLARCWSQSPTGTEHIQDVFPNLTPGEREFLMTGVTEEEWDEMWGEDDE